MMINSKIVLFIFLNFYVIYARISDKRLCGDPKCAEAISLAKTLLKYVSDDRRILSFPVNADVKIFSKEAGNRLDLWGAEIDGKRGYVPIGHVRETKILKKDVKYLLSTDEDSGLTNPAATISTENPNGKAVLDTIPSPTENPIKEQISPNTVTPHEVISGTTIYHDPLNDGPHLPSLIQNNDSSDTDPLKNAAPEITTKVDADKLISTESKEHKLHDTGDKSKEKKIYKEVKDIPNLINNFNNVLVDESPKFTVKEKNDNKISSDVANNKNNVISVIPPPEENTEQLKNSLNKTQTDIPVANEIKKEIDNEHKIKESSLNINGVPFDPHDSINSSHKTSEEVTEDPQLEIKVPDSFSSASSAKPDHKNDEPIAEPAEEFSSETNNLVESFTKNPNVTDSENSKQDQIDSVVEKNVTLNKESPEEEIKKEVDNLTDLSKPSFVDEVQTNPKISKQDQVDSVVEKNVTLNEESPEKEIKNKVVKLTDLTKPSFVDELQKNPEISKQDQVDSVVEKNVTLNEESPEKEIKNKVDKLTDLTKPSFVDELQKNPEISKQDQVNSVIEKNVTLNEEAPEEEIKNKVDKLIGLTKPSFVDEIKANQENYKRDQINSVNDKIETLNKESSKEEKTNEYNNLSKPTFVDDLTINVTNSKNSGQEVNDKIETLNKESSKEEIKNEYDNLSKPTFVDDIIVNVANSENFEQDQENETSHENSIEEIEIKYDNLQKSTSVNGVTVESPSLIADEVLQNDEKIDLNSVENGPVTENLLSVETLENVETSAEELPENNDEESFYFGLYSNIFGHSTEKEVSNSDTVNENSEKDEKLIGKQIVSDSNEAVSHIEETPFDKYLPSVSESISKEEQDMQSCDLSENPFGCDLRNDHHIDPSETLIWPIEVPENAYTIFLYSSITAVTVLLFTLGYYFIEKKRKDGTLVAGINTLEKKLLISTKENLLLEDELKATKERLQAIEDSSFGSDDMIIALKKEIEDAERTRAELQEQISNLEKELENATETAMELNTMLIEMMKSPSGNEHFKVNVDQLHKQLNDQQETIDSLQATLNTKNTEMELLQTELSVANEKVNHLEEELNKMAVKLLAAREEKTNNKKILEEQNAKLKTEFETVIKQRNIELKVLKEENVQLKQTVEEIQRHLDLKNNEFDLLQQGLKEVQTPQGNKDSLNALLDVSHVKAEVLQLREEKQKITEMLKKENDQKIMFENKIQVMLQDVQLLKTKFDEAEKEKVEAQTRLEVLSTYFKDREAQLQQEINENESKFMQKEGEATSTIERIKWIQEELQNYKSQNELLKKEILDQEVSLKSQISMLEKKSHDNWLLTRQAERRLEESKQEASQLRNRLTLVEKNLNNSSHLLEESKMQNRIMSPLESNGDIVSPIQMSNVEAPDSPPLLFPGLPSFMPPPLGMPFMPQLMPGVPPFIPPPPELFPGDHRPPPLGRMSSPPLHGHYSPDSRTYSPYDRDDSPPLSPAESDYRRRTPPPPRNYSPAKLSRPPYWERDEDRNYWSSSRNERRTRKGMSSGSGNSNDSLDTSDRHSGRV